MRRALLLCVALLGCNDVDPQRGCVFGLRALEVAEVFENPRDCTVCVCLPSGELDCQPLVGCRLDAGLGGHGDGGAPACPTGGVNGRACAPDETAIPGAVVRAATRDCAGRTVLAEAVADEAGHFLLRGLAPGPTTVTISAGRFQSRHDLTIEAERTLPIDGVSDKTCLAADAARLAVISGDYDRIEDVLDDLGFEYDLFCADHGNTLGARSLLGDWERLSSYDILFIDCGAHFDLRRDFIGPTLLGNLRRFVEEGGSVYASDLTAGLVTRAWPGAINFRLFDRPVPARTGPCCTCTDCPPECGDAEAGCVGCCMGPGVGECTERHTFGRGRSGTVDAEVLHPTLRAFLGADRLPIHFDADGWVQITGVTLRGELLVRADGRPLMATFGVGDAGGRVAYTSFHNRAQASTAVRQLLRALIFQL